MTRAEHRRFREQVAKAIRDGASAQECIDRFNVNPNTLSYWIQFHKVPYPPGFLRARSLICDPRDKRRQRKIIAMRKAGKTLQEIGDHFVISRERVRQLSMELSSGERRRWAGATVGHSTAYVFWRKLKRGQTLCAEWEDFRVFLAWFEENHIRGQSLVQKNTAQPTGPSNFEYVSRQGRHATSLPAFGETKTLLEWEADPRCSVSAHCIKQRVGILSWPIELAITAPPHYHHSEYFVENREN